LLVVAPNEKIQSQHVYASDEKSPESFRESILAIVGFRLPNGQVLNTLQLPEGSTVSAAIVARFTTDRVPAPGDAALLGLAGVFAGRRRR
jgi:MYXO-CTERM domain-containing protein